MALDQIASVLRHQKTSTTLQYAALVPTQRQEIARRAAPIIEAAVGITSDKTA
jgi:hypothetical protein